MESPTISLSRRGFLAISAGAAAAALTLRGVAAGAEVEGPKVLEEFSKWVPADKLLTPEVVAALLQRGQAETFSGNELSKIGMPVGGLFCGGLYIGGDGRLWLWDIFNTNQEGIVPRTVEYRGQRVKSRDGAAYVEPPNPADHRDVEQWFDLTWRSPVGPQTRVLDAKGFRDVTFTGQYPVATVTYRDPEIPISATMEAFSPFIPLNAADSSLPATIFCITLRNDSAAPVELTLASHLANAVLFVHNPPDSVRSSRVVEAPGMTLVHHEAAHAVPATAGTRPAAQPYDGLPDSGTMGVALLGPPAEVAVAAKLARGEAFPIGTVGRKMTLAPGESREVRFALVWHFANSNLKIHGVSTRRHYASKFPDAAAVATYVAANADRLISTTRLWRDTWNDSTLPHWFLNRTFATACCLATTTAHRFEDGRFWAWEGVGSCPGTCIHVWHYAQAMGRLFPEVERDHRARVDFGLALDASGVIHFRGENGATYAIDGQAGRVLGVYREHQMSADDSFARAIFPAVKRAVRKMIATDGDGDGLVQGPLHNTLDADWYGTVPWLCGMYMAGLRAAEQLALDLGDADFAAECRKILSVGPKNLDATCWSEPYGYFIHRGDEAHASNVGVYDGCHIDQVLGDAWSRQVGLGPICTPEHVRAALASLWRFNFTPDVGPLRNARTAGRWYAMPGEPGTTMVSNPYVPERHFTGGSAWSAMYFNECMTGFEHQLAAHMLWEGMVTESLAITHAIHERYHPRRRNPYNEIECSDHYARAMASYGSFLAACGFGCHGPKGELSFAPRLSPDDFRAAFTSAQGWGTFAQSRGQEGMKASIQLKYGQLSLAVLRLTPSHPPAKVTAKLAGAEVPAALAFADGVASVSFSTPLQLRENQVLEISLT